MVIGRPVAYASPEEAADAVFGVTCGNDVSERNWQRNTDRQWWRAKGCDTFGSAGALDCHGAGLFRPRAGDAVNGEVLQEQRTSDLLFDVPTVISFVSHYVTLTPGDLIYTGTPGTQRRWRPAISLKWNSKASAYCATR